MFIQTDDDFVVLFYTTKLTVKIRIHFKGETWEDIANILS